MTETWKPVPGWQEFYEVSDAGRLRSLPRVVKSRPGVTQRKPGKILTGTRREGGYLTFTLCLHGKRTTVDVHRLVLLAFVGPAPEGTEACHNDGDASNNTVQNLRWDTRSANTHDKVAHGGHPFARRTHCPQGHEYTLANTYTSRAPSRRSCRTCKNERKRIARVARKAAAA